MERALETVDAIEKVLNLRPLELPPRLLHGTEVTAWPMMDVAIAREYDISPRTIEVYRANVMTKMQAGSLSELVRLALRAGAVKD